jgi:hypothetical protein
MMGLATSLCDYGVGLMFTPSLDNRIIHLAVQGRCGGSTMGLQLAMQAISGGGRVLWAYHDLPDSARFSQIFSELSPADSSRFHAINISGDVSQAFERVTSAITMLPDVQLLVMDDWIEKTGRVGKKYTEAIAKVIAKRGQCSLFLISKGGESMKKEIPLNARGANKDMEVWLLTKPKDGIERVLTLPQEEIILNLKEEGFF